MAAGGDDRVSTVASTAARTVVVVDARPVVAYGLAAALTERGHVEAAAVSTGTELATQLRAGAPAALVLVLDRSGRLPIPPDPALTAALVGTHVVLIGSPGPSTWWPSETDRTVLPAASSVDQLAEEIACPGAQQEPGLASGGAPPVNDPSGQDRHGGRDVLAQLTAREHEVLSLLAEGRSTQEIAEKMSVSVNTMRTHVNSLLHKLGVHSRLRAVALFTDGTPDRSAADGR